jgi:asparagine synthase (glutamine-hydrolysing)
MCGISVSIALDRRQRQACTSETRAELEAKLSKSLDLIAHRGPDAKGIWINDDASIGTSPSPLRNRTRSLTKSPGLAHNRLSINDLSPSGNQPRAPLQPSPLSRRPPLTQKKTRRPLPLQQNP